MSATEALGHQVASYISALLLVVLLAAYAPAALAVLAVLCAAWWMVLRLFRHTDADDTQPCTADDDWLAQVPHQYGEDA